MESEVATKYKEGSLHKDVFDTTHVTHEVN